MNSKSLIQTSSNNAELPYEKFLRRGAGALTEAELLAIIIRTGTVESSPVELGEEILGLASVKENGLNGLHNVTVKELMSIKGIGEVKAVKIKCLAELSMRMAMARAGEKLQFLNPSSVAGYYMEKLRHEKKERVMLLLLDNRSCLLEECLLSIGTVNTSLLSPREVFVTALKAEAVYIMLLHNHPSGDPAPSKQDMMITDKIKRIGSMIDIELLDHIIIGDNKYMSFKEAGLL
ncbi:RadC family protein [Kineothrix sp. MB12-C1]|uniref:RadC family protein n=1 Tax=Kineothrix sp. MB12-C1 TaxID=3070215 RepID=UPI0027D2852A|nr:DNA repair protein RadC [Kineothrix sp. MB12-C1]WMC92759.1 DNA repair protein RadC [Kineothrix sp. MB12-C1]